MSIAGNVGERRGDNDAVATLQRMGNIDIGQDMDFQRREWRFQRAGWVLIGLLVLAGLLGLLGRGPLSKEQTGDVNVPLWAEFYSVDHYQADSELKLHLQGQAVTSDTLRLSLNQSYLERIDLQRIQPEPSGQELGSDRVIFVFDVVEPGQPLDVTFYYSFAQAGRAVAEVGVEGGPQLSFVQFVLP